MTDSSKLHFRDCVLLVIGIIVGIGIFETAPTINGLCGSVKEIVFLWLLGGVLSFSGMLCYGRLAERFPNDAGEYVFLSAAYKGIVPRSFLWAQVLVIRPGSLAALAFPFAHYTAAALGMTYTAFPESLLALSAVLLCTLLQLFGFNAARRAQNILTFCKAAAVTSIGIAAASRFAQGFVLVPHETTRNPGLALILILFTFGGWNEIVNVGARAKRGGAAITSVGAVSLSIVTILYIGMALSSLLIVGAPEKSSANPLASAMADGAASGRLFAAAVAISCLGAVHGLILTGAPLYAELVLHRAELTNTFVRNNVFLFQGAMAAIVVFITGSFSTTVVYTSAVVWIYFLLIGLSGILREERVSARLRYFIPPIIFSVLSAYLIYESVRYSPLGSAISIGLVVSVVFLEKLFSRKVDRVESDRT